MTLEKRNEIINFIGWREFNNTDTGNCVQVRELHVEIPEYDVNKVEIDLFARFQIQVKCYIKSD